MDLLGLILFDIDGVIRDVGNSYRLAVKKTVLHFCGEEPLSEEIDDLKNEGIWNNDWDLSLELINRKLNSKNINAKPPTKLQIIKLFEKLYFGCNPNEHFSMWTGFIKNEKLLVDIDFFKVISANGIKWGFVSGAELLSAKFVLEEKLNLLNPPLIAMGDAPDKPNPEGLISLSEKILEKKLGSDTPPVAYVGDTVADVQTVTNARKKVIGQKFISVAIAPPHLHLASKSHERFIYESNLREVGADYILSSINNLKLDCRQLFLP